MLVDLIFEKFEVKKLFVLYKLEFVNWVVENYFFGLRVFRIVDAYRIIVL